MPRSAETVHSKPVVIGVGDITLSGELAVPANAAGIVVFAHGSGSSRFSPRNQRVAEYLQRGGLGTLLFDLLTADEEAIDESTAQYRFDIPMLGVRLTGAIDWLESDDVVRSLSIGCFGASTGAAGALIAAANRPDHVRAVVSRGGRPDLAGPALARVSAPTLLIVGGDDVLVIGMNQTAMEQLAAPTKRLEIVPGATHLFEEPGTLERVCELALDWFNHYLTSEA